MKRQWLYVLDENRSPVPADIDEWGLMFSETDRVVDVTTMHTPNRMVTVSTVFLGMDHRFGNPGPPILFETMIFGLDGDEPQWRYATWNEAEAGYRKAVAGLMGGYVENEASPD